MAFDGDHMMEMVIGRGSQHFFHEKFWTKDECLHKSDYVVTFYPVEREHPFSKQHWRDRKPPPTQHQVCVCV